MNKLFSKLTSTKCFTTLNAYNFDGTDYDSTNGIGKLYNYYLAGSTDEKVFLRGGDWYYGTNAGLLYLILLIDSVYQDYSNGFRCSVVP